MLSILFKDSVVNKTQSLASGISWSVRGENKQVAQPQCGNCCCCCCCSVASVVSDSVWPHRRQPTRPPHPWDSPGKNTGVGCHFLLQCMKVKSESEVAQSCPTLRNPMDCSQPGSSVLGIFQARVLEWGAIREQDPRKVRAASVGLGGQRKWWLSWNLKKRRWVSQGKRP